MPKFKAKLMVPVKITAYCEIDVEAETTDAAYDKALEVYQELGTKYKEAMAHYRQAPATHTWPTAPYYWYINEDDIEGTMDDRQIEVEGIEK
jgi:hypothetical protein